MYRTVSGWNISYMYGAIHRRKSFQESNATGCLIATSKTNAARCSIPREVMFTCVHLEPHRWLDTHEMYWPLRRRLHRHHQTDSAPRRTTLTWHNSLPLTGVEPCRPERRLCPFERDGRSREAAAFWRDQNFSLLPLHQLRLLSHTQWLSLKTYLLPSCARRIHQKKFSW